jgi:hypothetical protein
LVLLLPQLKIFWLSNLSILSVPDEGYSRLSVPDEGYSRLSVSDEGYSRLSVSQYNDQKKKNND